MSTKYATGTDSLLVVNDWIGYMCLVVESETSRRRLPDQSLMCHEAEAGIMMRGCIDFEKLWYELKNEERGRKIRAMNKGRLDYNYKLF